MRILLATPSYYPQTPQEAMRLKEIEYNDFK
jgi:hypothetical protein